MLKKQKKMLYHVNKKCREAYLQMTSEVSHIHHGNITDSAHSDYHSLIYIPHKRTRDVYLPVNTLN